MDKTNRRRIPRHLLAGAGVLAMLILVSACTGSSEEGAADGSTVNVSLHDFRIDSAVTQAKSGDVTFRIHNEAPMTHEFVVVRSNLAPANLAIGADGLSVDEDKLHSVGELSEVRAGAIDSLHLKLPPGRYVYFCNLEGHYLGGMHGVLTVSDNA